MKSAIIILLLALVAVASTESCQASSFQLLAGQTIDAGSVEVTNSESAIQVKISAKDGWLISQVHIYAGKTAPETVAPGQFPFKQTLSEPSSSFTAVFALPAGLDCSSAFALAVHTNVIKQDGSGTTTQSETAWARGEHAFLDTSRWGWWADYQAQCGCGSYDSGTNSTNSGNVDQCCACSGSSGSSSSSSSTCVPHVTKVFAGQTIHSADIVVTNDADSFTIAVTTQPDWFIDVIHIYFGTGEPLPLNNQGTPVPGQFPFQIALDHVSSWTMTWTLEELNATFGGFQPACGQSYYLLVHFDMANTNGDHETGWAFGDTPFSQFGSTRWGWAVNYTWCCPTSPPDSNEGCTFTQGYWKNHNWLSTRPSQKIAWPLPEDTMLCSMSWLSILQTPIKGDKWYILAHQWIAAKLNVANGASPSDISKDLLDGETLLNLCSFSTKDQEKLAVAIAANLTQYNEGIIGPGHCDDNTISTDVCECRCPVSESQTSGSLPSFQLSSASEPRQVLGLALQKEMSNTKCKVELNINSGGDAKLVVTNPVTKVQLTSSPGSPSVEFDFGPASSVIIAVETNSQAAGSVSVSYPNKATSGASSMAPAMLLVLGAIMMALL